MVYWNNNTQKFTSKYFSNGHYSLKDLSSTPSRQSSPPPHLPFSHSLLTKTDNPKLEKTIAQSNFETGDYLDLVYLSPPTTTLNNPSTLYSDRTTSNPRITTTGQPFNQRNSSFPPPRGSLGGGTGQTNGPRDANAPPGVWGRNPIHNGRDGNRDSGRESGFNGAGRDGRDGPPHKPDTWAPRERGNERGARGFDGRNDVRYISLSLPLELSCFLYPLTVWLFVIERGILIGCTLRIVDNPLTTITIDVIPALVPPLVVPTTTTATTPSLPVTTTIQTVIEDHFPALDQDRYLDPDRDLVRRLFEGMMRRRVRRVRREKRGKGILR